MSNKDQNNNPSWSSRLDELDSLPGENSSGKNRSWEKLQARLQEKKENKKMAWYWAAACLFALILLPWALQHKKEEIGFAGSPSVKQPNIPADTAMVKNNITVPVKKNKDIPPSIKVNVPAANSTASKLPQPVKKKIPDGDTVTTPAESIVATVPVNNLLNNPTVTDTGKVIAAVAPSKKKLRIVHINEITDPAQTGFTNSTEGNSEFRRFVKPVGKDFSRGTISPGTNSTEHILIRNINAQN